MKNNGFVVKVIELYSHCELRRILLHALYHGKCSHVRFSLWQKHNLQSSSAFWFVNFGFQGHMTNHDISGLY